MTRKPVRDLEGILPPGAVATIAKTLGVSVGHVFRCAKGERVGSRRIREAIEAWRVHDISGEAEKIVAGLPEPEESKP